MLSLYKHRSLNNWLILITFISIDFFSSNPLNNNWLLHYLAFQPTLGTQIILYQHYSSFLCLNALLLAPWLLNFFSINILAIPKTSYFCMSNCCAVSMEQSGRWAFSQVSSNLKESKSASCPHSKHCMPWCWKQYLKKKNERILLPFC